MVLPFNGAPDEDSQQAQADQHIGDDAGESEVADLADPRERREEEELQEDEQPEPVAAHPAAVHVQQLDDVAGDESHVHATKARLAQAQSNIDSILGPRARCHLTDVRVAPMNQLATPHQTHDRELCQQSHPNHDSR